APTCAAVEGAIPAPTSPAAAPTRGCDADAPTGGCPAAAPTGRSPAPAPTGGCADRGRSSDWMKPAITEIGADAEGATDRSAMDAGDRQRRERPPDSGVGL